jgi:hypothetical protein
MKRTRPDDHKQTDVEESSMSDIDVGDRVVEAILGEALTRKLDDYYEAVRKPRGSRLTRLEVVRRIVRWAIDPEGGLLR